MEERGRGKGEKWMREVEERGSGGGEMWRREGEVEESERWRRVRGGGESERLRREEEVEERKQSFKEGVVDRNNDFNVS